MKQRYEQLDKWQREAINFLLSDIVISEPTSLYCAYEIHGIKLYLKDETQNPTRSHKHRLARALFLYGLFENKINKETSIIDISSESTARAEAYFAEKLRLKYYAVLPKTTAIGKIKLIEQYDGNVIFCDPGNEKQTLVDYTTKDYYFIDQFSNATRALFMLRDLFGEFDLIQELKKQIKERESNLQPSYVLCDSRMRSAPMLLSQNFDHVVMVDPEHSAFFRAFQQYLENEDAYRCQSVEFGSRIEDIDSRRIESGFDPDYIESIIQVPDAASIAALRYHNARYNHRVDNCTGTNLYACFYLMNKMIEQGRKGYIVSFIFDSSQCYQNTYHSQHCNNNSWFLTNGVNYYEYSKGIENFLKSQDKDKAIQAFSSINSLNVLVNIHKTEILERSVYPVITEYPQSPPCVWHLSFFDSINSNESEANKNQNSAGYTQIKINK